MAENTVSASILGRFGRVGLVATAVAALLAATPHAQHAYADAASGTPTLQSAQLLDGTATLRFIDYSTDYGGDLGLPTNHASITVVAFHAQDQVHEDTRVFPGAPGDGRTRTEAISGLRSDIGYCFKVATVSDGDTGDIIDGIPASEFDASVWSNEVCVAPTTAASAPVLELSKIGGKLDLTHGAQAAYAIELENHGGDAHGVTITIGTTGALTATQVLADSSAGWSCSPTTLPGVAHLTAAFTCTGGTVPHTQPGASVGPGLFVTATGTGLGDVTASVSIDGGVANSDPNATNNTIAVSVS